MKNFFENDPRFVFYMFETLDLTGFNSGSVQPMLNRNYVSQVQICLPPLAEQRAIASVLSALDDKIEANSRLAKTVLNLAVALYLKAVSSSVARRVVFRDVGLWLSGGTPSTSEGRYWGGDLPWISAASMKSFFVDASDRTLTPAGAAAGTRVVPPGSIIFVVRGMSLKTEFRVGVAQREVAFGQDCKAVVVDSGYPSCTIAVGLLAARDKILDLVDEAGHGTGRLATDRIERFELLLPSITSAPLVEERMAALLARGAAAEEESRRLAALRDALLQPLVSGVLRVRDAKELVGQAV